MADRKKYKKVASRWITIINALSPNDTVPTPSQILQKFKNGTATVRDGMIARLYGEGMLFKMDNDVLKKRFPKDLADRIINFQNNFEFSGLDETAKGQQTTNSLKGLEFDVNVFDKSIRKDVVGIKDPLSLKLTELEELFESGSFTKKKSWTPTQNVIDRLKSDGVYRAPKGKSVTKGTRKLDKIDGKKVLKTILTNIAKIEDINTKAAILVAMFGQRGEALVNMTKSLELATELGPTEYDPFYDIETNEIVNPSDRTGIAKKGGRKRLPPTTKVGPLLQAVLTTMHKNTDGDLFKIDVKKLTDTLNKIIYTGIEDEVQAGFGRALKGYTDLRRIFASTIINEMAEKVDDPEIKRLYGLYADQLLGHTNTSKGISQTEDLIGKVMRDHYATVNQGKSILKPGDIMVQFEKFFAEALGATDEKGKLSVRVLANAIGLPDDLKGIDKTYQNDIKKSNPQNSRRTVQQDEIVSKVQTNVNTNIVQNQELDIISGQKKIEDAALSSYESKLEKGKKLGFTGSPDEIVQKAEGVIEREQAILQQPKKKKITANKDFVDTKLADNIKKAKEMGVSLKEYMKNIKGGKLGAVLAVGTGSAAIFPETADAADVINVFVPPGAEIAKFGGVGRGLKYADGSVLTKQEEDEMRMSKPDEYAQMEAAFQQEQAYQQEQENIKEELKRTKQKEEMDRLLADPLGAID
mgnify:CR=1 FL=1